MRYSLRTVARVEGKRGAYRVRPKPPRLTVERQMTVALNTILREAVRIIRENVLPAYWWEPKIVRHTAADWMMVEFNNMRQAMAAADRRRPREGVQRLCLGLNRPLDGGE